MSELWSWKRLSSGEILQSRAGQQSVEDLFKVSSFRLPVRDVSSAGYVAVRVTKVGNVWVEAGSEAEAESEKDRIWRLIVGSSTS